MGGNSISGTGSSSSAASSSYGGSGVASLVAEYGSEGSRSRASTPEPIDLSTRPFFVTVAQVLPYCFYNMCSCFRVALRCFV
jgi:hypothetical protein